MMKFYVVKVNQDGTFEKALDEEFNFHDAIRNAVNLRSENEGVRYMHMSVDKYNEEVK